MLSNTELEHDAMHVGDKVHYVFGGEEKRGVIVRQEQDWLGGDVYHVLGDDGLEVKRAPGDCWL